jgi:hypothetical protein
MKILPVFSTALLLLGAAVAPHPTPAYGRGWQSCKSN